MSVYVCVVFSCFFCEAALDSVKRDRLITQQQVALLGQHQSNFGMPVNQSVTVAARGSTFVLVRSLGRCIACDEIRKEGRKKRKKKKNTDQRKKRSNYPALICYVPL